MASRVGLPVFLLRAAAIAVFLAACQTEEEGGSNETAPTEITSVAPSLPSAPSLPVSPPPLILGTPIPMPDAPVIGGAPRSDVPPSYERPVDLHVVAGSEVPDRYPAYPAEQYEAALEATKGRPQFEGEVNGFRLYSFEHAFSDPSVERKFCVTQEWPLMRRLTFYYLPVGTHAGGPQFAGRCADGSLNFVMQEFEGGGGDFQVVYQPGDRAFGQDSLAEYVGPATVQGRNAVVIAPLVEGYGRSWVAFASDNGLVLVNGLRLPLNEALKIAEGVRCEGC